MRSVQKRAKDNLSSWVWMHLVISCQECAPLGFGQWEGSIFENCAVKYSPSSRAYVLRLCSAIVLVITTCFTSAQEFFYGRLRTVSDDEKKKTEPTGS